MGKNLALNMERNGFCVAVFNRTYSVTEEFLANAAKGKKIAGYKTLKDFAGSLEKPRKIFMMIKAGKAIDELIHQITPLLEKGDILIDAGNSLYTDTERRAAQISSAGVHYMGMGISGGEEGALWGPSIMPGGDKEAYGKLVPILEKIAAKPDSGPCFTYVGEGGAGHFVKMVHNGIEYGDMQLIAEIYDILRRGFNLSPPAISEIFSEWNQGLLKSYLMEITADLLKFKESPDSAYLVDLILDKAGQKGTGGWTVQAAMQEGVAIPTITAAVDARILSALKEERVQAAKIYSKIPALKPTPLGKEFLPKLMLALYASKICCYAQGFALMHTANQTHGYGINLSEIARIWKAGCIIRAVFLERIREAYDQKPDLPNLVMAPGFQPDFYKSLAPWIEALNFAVGCRIPIPALSASFAYFNTYITESLAANLIQAQRDYFGAHQYERIDKPGVFHTRWNK